MARPPHPLAILLALGLLPSPALHGTPHAGASSAAARREESRAPAGGALRACTTWAEKATRTGRVPDALEELSGVAASRRHPGVYWAHNDSNNAATLFAIDATGEILARFPLRGVRPRDTEDIAVGPCSAGSAQSCIYLGDIGDNLGQRSEVWIDKMPEPDALDGRPLDVDAFAFRYPDGSRNAEGLLVDPRSAEVYVVTKTVDGLGEVFRIDDLAPGRKGRAVRVAELAAPATLARLSTAADAHPGGERVLLRTYAGVWELHRPGAASLAEVFAAKPVEVTNGAHIQAEGVAWAPDGASYLLTAEGRGSPIYRVECTRFSAEPDAR